MNNNTDTNTEVAAAVKAVLSSTQSDTSVRNDYINTRDKIIYQDGLFDNIEFPDGADRTLYNLCKRAINIHTSQFMGRGFKIYSTYNKISDLEENPQENSQENGQEETEQPDAEKQGKLLDAKNKLVQENSNVRKKVIDGIIEDNGGFSPWMNRAQMCSAYGFSVVKQWGDFKAKKVKQVTLETPQQYYTAFSDSDFREREADAYVDQISQNKAYKDYGSYLKEGEKFELSDQGMFFSDPAPVPADSTQARNQMVTRIEFTGIISEWCGYNGKLKKCKKGDETPINVTIVGGKVTQVITDEAKLPRYYLLPNIIEPRRMWAKSDLDQSAIEINQTYIEAMSTWATLYQKEVYNTYKAKGFEGQRIPQRIRKATTFIPMSQEQDIMPLDQPGNFGAETKAFVEELKENFVRVAKIGRVLFDDPTINPSSNQALMTTLKGVVDVVEEKQSNWEPILKEMFKDALDLAAQMVPALKPVVEEDGWDLKIEWPSILRKEDATYQQMWLNRFNSNTTSLETYMEAMGVDDPIEEVDRIRDEMKDPVTAAVLSRQLGALAGQVISPQGPPSPDVKVSLRGDLTPFQEANIASQQGFNEGPYPPTAGPQGQGGLAAQENQDNQGFVEGNPFAGGTPIQQSPDGQPLPQLTPDQNTGQTASMPGSGAPAVSPQGALNQVNQREGK